MELINYTRILCFALICGSALLLQTCCVKEDLSDCEQKVYLYIVVEEGVDDASLDGASLFLFNKDRTYLNSIQVSAEDILGNVPILISYKKDNIPWAEVWGNLGDREEVSRPVEGGNMENMYIYIKKDTDGYTVAADNLLFGIKQLSGSSKEYLKISPKTGRIYITVKGLTEDEINEKYYFTVETPYGGYDFAGTPVLLDKTVLKLPCIFSGKDLITPEAYNMVHFPSGVTGSGAKVNLYRVDTAAGNDYLVASADRDTDGLPIVLSAGKTTNIMIDLGKGGDIEISVRISDWGEITQWDEW